MDNEVAGTGNQYDYGFRIYNPRIAKFLSVDPLTKSYPMLTPYQFASNRPIDGVDLDGLEYVHYKVYSADLEYGTILFTMKNVRNIGTEKATNIDYKNILLNEYYDKTGNLIPYAKVNVLDYNGDSYLVRDEDLLSLDLETLLSMPKYDDLEAINEIAESWGETLRDLLEPAKGVIEYFWQPYNVDIDIGHITEGQYRGSLGKFVGGHHWEGIRLRNFWIKPGTKEMLNQELGVYKATIVTRIGENETFEKYNNTFFPDTWSINDVQNSVSEAFINAQNGRAVDVIDGYWEGVDNTGFKVAGYYNWEQDKVTTAYPNY